MHRFFITIKKDGKIFGNLEKVPIILDTSGDIVKQVDELTSSLLDSFEVEKDNRNNISWKIYQYKGSKYMMVSRSRTWVDS